MADAGRRMIHSQRPSASPTTTERSHSPSDPLTDTGHRPTGKLPIRTLTVGGPSPTSSPGSIRPCGPRPAIRAPSPVPASSLTTMTSTGPSSALVPDTQVIVARPSRPSAATEAKSVTVQPGPSGHGRYVGKPPA